MLASAVFPVAILFALKSADDLRSAAGLAIAVGAVWLMNAPAAVMLMYTLALLLLVIASSSRSIRPLLHGAVGLSFGLGLAAFYLIPAAFEQSWVNIYGIFGSGLTPKENFLFSVATDAPHTYFNFLVSGIALEQIALFAFAVWFAWRAQTQPTLRRLVLPALTSAGIFAALMMFRFSTVLWSLPKMQFIQFPWRWMLVLNVALCLTGMLALTRARTKWLWALLVVAFLGHTERDVIRQATWGRRAIAEMYWATSGDGYRGAKEYLPHEARVAPKPYLLPSAAIADLSCEIPCPPDALKVLRWSEEEKKIQVGAAVPASLTVKLYDYPAWQVLVDGAPVQHEVTFSGLIKMTVPPGRHDIDIRFTRTPDRTVGALISALSAITLLLFIYFANSRRNSEAREMRATED
jgi:hypothetical protein